MTESPIREEYLTRENPVRLTGIHRHGRNERMSDTTSDESFHILLVEDNPGDVRLNIVV